MEQAPLQPIDGPQHSPTLPCSLPVSNRDKLTSIIQSHEPLRFVATQLEIPGEGEQAGNQDQAVPNTQQQQTPSLSPQRPIFGQAVRQQLSASQQGLALICPVDDGAFHKPRSNQKQRKLSTSLSLPTPTKPSVQKTNPGLKHQETSPIPKLQPRGSHAELVCEGVKIRMLDGEQKVVLEDCLFQVNNQWQSVKLLLTNYRVCLGSPSGVRLDVPLGFISKFSRVVESKAVVCTYIDLVMKFGVQYRLKFLCSVEISERIFDILGKLCFSATTDMFAFEHRRNIKNSSEQNIDSATLASSNGWNYNGFKDYARMGLLLADGCIDYPWGLVKNDQGSLCQSYPEVFVIPSKLGEDSLSKCLKHRSKERVPALSYAFETNKTKHQFSLLWRSSQARPSTQNSFRNFADEEYIRLLGIQHPGQKQVKNQKNLVIFDIKPKQLMSTMSTNKALGLLSNYKNAIPKVVQMPTLDSTRQAHNRAVVAFQSIEPTKWLKAFQDSNWLDQLNSLIRGAFDVTQDMEEGYNILVQCAQGTDRTAQICSLVQIILDPYYRTTEGLATLLEKEFTSFGHQFALRLGWKKDRQREDQKSPVMVQLLDCIFQLTRAYPLSFQYTSKYLARVSKELYSNRYGNFLFNSQQEQLLARVPLETLSIWKQLECEECELYQNPYYKSPDDTDMYRLKRCASQKAFVAWQDHFSGLVWGGWGQSNYQNQITLNTSDYLLFFHNKVKKETDQFKQLISDQYSTINSLKAQVQELDESSYQPG